MVHSVGVLPSHAQLSPDCLGISHRAPASAGCSSSVGRDQPALAVPSGGVLHSQTPSDSLGCDSQHWLFPWPLRNSWCWQFLSQEGYSTLQASQASGLQPALAVLSLRVPGVQPALAVCLQNPPPPPFPSYGGGGGGAVPEQNPLGSLTGWVSQKNTQSWVFCP